MAAVERSSLAAMFAPDQGTITFAGLEAQTGADYSGASLDMAGTIQWTCPALGAPDEK